MPTSSYPAVATPRARSGSVAVALSTGQPLMASLATPETLVFDNAGKARTDVTVHLAFQAGNGRVHGGNLLEFGSVGLQVHRVDQANGTSLNVAMAENSTSSVYGSYVTSVPAGVSTQHLTINGQFTSPFSDGAVPVTVRLTAGQTQLVKHGTTFRVSNLIVRKTAGPGTVQRGTQTEYDFTVTNPSTLTYPDIYLGLSTSCGAKGASCDPGANATPGLDVDWYDGTGWKPVVVNGSDPSPYNAVLTSGPLPPGTTTIRLRLILGASLSRSADFSQLMLDAQLPMPAGAQGAAWIVAFGRAQVRIG
jgi:hypothetical protein